MATLERIRKSSGLLVVVIGMAMMAFILTDLLSSGNSFLRGSANAVGSVNGDKIDIQEFNRLMDQARATYVANTQDATFQNATDKQFADQVWNRLMREKLYAGITEGNGITISEKELYERIINNPNIRDNQSFKDPNTGQFSEAVFRQALSQIQGQRGTDPQVDEMWTSWVEFEQAMEEQGGYDKLHKLAQSAVYYPEALAKNLLNEQGQNFRGRFVALRYTDIPDSTLEVTDSDISAYLSENAGKYEREAQRDILYVNFPIEASVRDKQEMLDELSALRTDRVLPNEATGTSDTIKGFEQTDDDSLFVTIHSDIPYDKTYYKKEDLLPALDSAIWEAPIGFVHGPYVEGTVYQLAKVRSRITLPDSAKARHILIAYQGAERAAQTVVRTPMEAKTIADSVFAYIREDISRFKEVNDSLSDDVVAQTKSGDLGWFQQNSMARPFGDFCFYREKGALGMVYTNFGIHIVEITDQSDGEEAIQVARVARNLQPSERTLNDLYNEASSFASSVDQEGFGARAEEQGYSPRPVTALEEFDENISGLGNNRAIVRWTFEDDRSVGDIQLFSNGTKSYVVVLLDRMKEEGLPEISEVELNIRPKVLVEKKKEILLKKMEAAAKSSATVEELATALGLEADKIFDQKLNFAQVNVTGIGGEPGFVAMMSSYPINELFPPFAGDRAVFCGVVVERDPTVEQGDHQSLVDQNLQPMRTRMPNALFQAMEKTARIKDMRAKYY